MNEVELNTPFVRVQVAGVVMIFEGVLVKKGDAGHESSVKNPPPVTVTAVPGGAPPVLNEICGPVTVNVAVATSLA